MPITAGQKLRASDFNPPFGHAGITAGFIAISAANGAYPTMAAQVLENGMTFSSNGLMVPKAGLYEIVARPYFTGGSGYTCVWGTTINSTALPATYQFVAGQIHKPAVADETPSTTVRARLAANDRVRLHMSSTQSTYGTTGYNGAYLEVLFVAP